jgi:hypothetical protein
MTAILSAFLAVTNEGRHAHCNTVSPRSVLYSHSPNLQICRFEYFTWTDIYGRTRMNPVYLNKK